MSKKDPVILSHFINVLVTAVPTRDSGTGDVTYKTSFTPQAVQVQSPDTVINYQLVGPTPEDVLFESVSLAPGQTQLGTPSIGRSGKLVTFSNANTSNEGLPITLYLVDGAGHRFAAEAQVINDAPLGWIAAAPRMALANDPEEPSTSNPGRFV